MVDVDVILCDDEEKDDSILFVPSNKKEIKNIRNVQYGHCSTRLPLLAFEQSLMLKTLSVDALFILAKGLGIEQLFLNHLHSHNNPRFITFVLNTRPEDEHYFLERLKGLDSKCAPKVITSNVLVKDRILIYNTGAIQFVTSRILSVDLLKNRVPLEKVAGIFIYRAHEILSSFQESFIINVLREKCNNVFVKAFTDDSTRIANPLSNQLPQLLERLHLKNVFIVPRNYEAVKKSFDNRPLRILPVLFDLCEDAIVIRKCLFTLISTCVGELQKSIHNDLQLSEFFGTDYKSIPGDVLCFTDLEFHLRQCTLLLTERQRRILSDVHILRILLQKIENLDYSNAWYFLNKIRNEKDVLNNNSGWIYTPWASQIFSRIESLCFRESYIKPLPKWSAFCHVLKKINHQILQCQQNETTDESVVVLASNEKACRQLIDLIKFGEKRLLWILSTAVRERHYGPTVDSGVLNDELEVAPLWNSALVSFYDDQVLKNDHLGLLKQVQNDQKRIGREKIQKRAPKLDLTQKDSGKQHLEWNQKLKYATAAESEINGLFNSIESRLCRLAQSSRNSDSSRLCLTRSEMFSRLQSCESFCKENGLEYDENQNDDSVIILNNNEILSQLNSSFSFLSSIYEPEFDDMVALHSLENFDAKLIFLTLGNRYNLLNCLEKLKPHYIILYNVDLLSLRIIENFQCHNPLHTMKVYLLKSSLNTIQNTDNQSGLALTEELRFSAVQEMENFAFEMLVSEDKKLKHNKDETNVFEGANNISGITKKDYEKSFTSKKSPHPTIKRSNADIISRNLVRKSIIRSHGRRSSLLMAKRHSSATNIPTNIVVDIREFNSELPTVLYKRGIVLDAVTLEVGDYILTPKICVERKGLDDLAQSLNSGRIFKQVEEMFRHYPRVILLIESREKFKKTRVNFGSFQGELFRRSREIRLLLTTLVRNNPRLKLFWSVSPSQSANLFEQLKVGQLSPDAEIASLMRSGDWVAEATNECELNDSSVYQHSGLTINRTQQLNSTVNHAEINDNSEKNVEKGVRKSKKTKIKVNQVIKRQLLRLPLLNDNEVENLMYEVNKFVRKNKDSNTTLCGINSENTSSNCAILLDFVSLPSNIFPNFLTNNSQKAIALCDFLNMDFRVSI